MSDILPPDALLPMRQYLTFVGRNTEPHEVQPNSPFDMIRRLVDSHEALRARLAEVEAERDEAVRRSALDEAQCDHMTDTAGRLAVELAAAEARLAEAVELLRGLTERHPMSPAGAGARMAARAFIEEQGQ